MTAEAIRRKALAALRPPANIPLADWIEANVRLPATESAMPGPMRLWSYQRGICEAIDDPEIERVSVIKSARIGYTALQSAVIANYVANAPAPMIALQPTTDDARGYSVELESTFEASPELRGLIAAEADDNGRSTMLARRFPGGSLKFLAARATRNLRRHAAKILVMDEVDGYEVTAEGDPIALATMRTQTFPDRKIIAGSTPIFDTGAISRLYAESDRRVFECRCPSCGEFSEVTWASIRWDDGKPETAHWVCPANGCVVEERYKVQMVAEGRWRATAPEVKGHAGFKINSLVSPHANARWPVLVAEFLQAKRAPELLQTFTNLTLGEPWRAEGDDLDESELASRREAFTLEALPPEVLYLTCGVDCQDDRLEPAIFGFDRDGVPFGLRFDPIWGPIDSDIVWQELDSLLRQRWTHPNGGTIGIDAAVIDSGDGGHADIVYAFTRSRAARRIVSGKGVPGFSRPALEKSKSGGNPLWLVGVDAVKSQLFARLAAEAGDVGRIRFSRDLPPRYFEELTSERRVMRYTRGKPQVRFERIKGRRAEGLDSTVYAIAARALIGIKPDQRAEELASAAAPVRRAPVIRSAFMDGARW